MLPHSDKDEQKLEIKKHIGNDRVAIVFQDEDTPFSPKMIKSKLLHVFLVIQPFQDDSYKVSSAVHNCWQGIEFGKNAICSPIFIEN